MIAISLTKPLTAELDKKNLTNLKAGVALVMDISGSMGPAYRDGTVQAIVNKIFPVAVQFGGELDFWYFGNTCERQPAVNRNNYKNAVPADWFDLMKKLGYGNDEPVVMKEIIAEYVNSKLPVLVVFISDGNIRLSAQIKQLLIEASYLPIFWQFIGVRGSNYGILEELDTLSGRYVDNANFFAINNLRSMSDEEFYSRLFNEFPAWLELIKSNGISDGGSKLSPTSAQVPNDKSLLAEVKNLFGW